MWFYNDLNLLHALRRANPQHLQSNDQGEAESISCQVWRVFATVWLFFLYWRAWSLKRRRLLPSCRSFREWLRLILVSIAALNKFYTKNRSTYFVCWQSNWTGEEGRTRNVQYSLEELSLPVLCWYTITLWRPLQSQIPRPHGHVGSRLLKPLPVNNHSEAVVCTDGAESMIILLVLILPLTK